MATAAQLRRFSLALEGVTEALHFDRAAFKTKRIFVTLAADGRSANFRLSPDEQEFICLMAPEVFAALPNAWGRQGWTSGKLAPMNAERLQATLAIAWARGVST